MTLQILLGSKRLNLLYRTFAVVNRYRILYDIQRTSIRVEQTE